MGRKNKNKSYRKKKQQSQPLPPLAEDFKQYLYLEALEGINKIKLSKDLFLAKQVNEAYILSKQWLDQWKLHVGYDAVLKGSQPAGKKYGRIQIVKINSDIIANDEEFHDAPESYSYFNPPLIHKVQPVRDYILVNQEVWEYFREKYEGSAIKRILNEKRDFSLKILSPFVLFLTQEKIQKIRSFNTNQLASQIEQLRIRRVQAFSDWEFGQLISYLKEFMGGQKVQLWLVNPVLELSQMKMQLMKTINSQKNLIFGEQLLEVQYEAIPLSSFLKDQYLLIVADEKLDLTQMEFQFEQNQNGCCFNCGNKALLNIICACRNAFYCSDTCRYQDQEFHSKKCLKAYDSEDDDRFDEIDYDKIQKSKGTGLVNLGNTCYMNSSLQSLFSSIHFQQFLSNKLYWNEKIEKKNVQLNYKLEKLLKNLLLQEKAFSPYSFRQQLAKKFPFFGNNFQQDAAEFLLYLFDALNEELIIKDGQKEIVKNEMITQQLDTEQKEQQISDSEEECSSDEENQEQISKFSKMYLFLIKQQQINNDNYEQALDQILKQNSQLINTNFLGITKSEVECPICTTKTYSYEQFSILPLSLNVTSQTKHLVDIYVVYSNWFSPYRKETYEYQPNQTLLMDVKRDIGEKLNIIPTFLLGVICSDHTVDTYLFHDEDPIDKIIREHNNNYICLFELDQEIQTITDDDQYFDVSIFSFEKRTAYSFQCESIAVSIPKILIVKKDATSLQIYQQIWHKLGEYSHSDQLIQSLIEEPQQKDLLTQQQVLEVLTYQIMIETRLPAKTPCPFTCGKQFKKEQKQHNCELPYNNSITLDSYLQKINYKNAHTSFIIEFRENALPKQIRIEFEQRTSYQNKEKCINKHILALALQDLIGNFQSKEPLLDENAYHCMTCNDLTFAIKTMKIQRLPDQLILQLKRFQYDEHKGFQKNNVLVTYPEKFTLNDITYQLYGVVQHFGGLDNGHYTALGLRQNTWIEFNDELVGDAKNVLNDKNAYILFYQQE